MLLSYSQIHSTWYSHVGIWTVEDASPMWVYKPDAWTVENKSDQEPEKFLDPTSHATSQQVGISLHQNSLF
jgi:hypothetical protein